MIMPHKSTKIRFVWDRGLWMTMPNMKINMSSTICQDGYRRGIGFGWVIPMGVTILMLIVSAFGEGDVNVGLLCFITLANFAIWFNILCHDFVSQMMDIAGYNNDIDNMRLLNNKSMHFVNWMLVILVVYSIGAFMLIA